MSRENVTHKGSFITKTLSAIVIACALTAIHTAPTAAQTATDLDCKDCIKSKQIKDGKIKGKDLKDLTVSNDKIEDGAVDSSKIEDSSVANVDLGGDSVTSDKISDGTVDTPDLAGSAVTGGKIATGAVNSLKVQNDSITALDLSSEAGVDFLHDPGQPVDIDISDTWAVLKEIGITHPADGYVTCIGMGHADFDATNDSNPVYLGWHTVSGIAVPPSYNRMVDEPAAISDQRIPLSTMHTFQVSGAGTTTFYLKARTDSANAGAFDYSFHALACMYFPTRY